MVESDLSAARARELLSYDPATGDFVWLVARGSVQVGDSAGHIGKKGYLVLWLDGQRFRAHRVAWLMTHGHWPAHHIDHKNRIPTDNRIDNLREITNAGNMQNKDGVPPHSQSGVRGVTHCKDGSYRARIMADGQHRSLGLFATAEEASMAYQRARGVLHPFYSSSSMDGRSD